MKKLVVLILISIFLYNQVGYFVAFKVMQYEVRKEIKRKIKSNVPQGELTVIRIGKGNDHELDWVKENKEFRYKGNLYDVVRQENAGDITVYHCINDVQEQTLFTQLDDHVKKHMAGHSSPGKQQAKAAIKDYFFHEIYIPSLNSNGQFIQYPMFNEAILVRFDDPSSPPPEYI